MLKKTLPLIILSIFVFIFFFRLFYPTLSIFMIPDFGQSDVLHLNLPLKYLLSESLKIGQWPLWSPHLASGFPILAEGQIGTFYLPNLLFFRFLPLVWAYNINLLIAYLLLSWGTYLFGRKIGLSKISSFFGGFIFTFSGFFAVHLNHFNLIQAASLLPWIFWTTTILWQKPDLKSAILLAFFVSQQIFTGHFYIVFITLVGLLTFLMGMSLQAKRGDLYNILKIASSRRYVGNRNDNKRRSFVFIFSFLIAFLLSAIQLLPTIELWQQSSRKTGLDFATVTDYPYPFKHLVTFIKPYLFGNPADGSYPSFNSEWGIFWENTAYAGLLPLILTLISLFFLKDRFIRTFFLMLFICLLLALGRNSPLYFIFSIPPFNFFRVPSKFLLLVTFSISILAAISLEKIKSQMPAIASICDKRKICCLIVLVVFLFIFFDVYKFSYNYPPVTPADWWLTVPESISLISANKDLKISSALAPYSWNQVFKKSGWQDMKPYVFFKNSLYPNYNAFYKITQADINTGGLVPRRLSIFKDLAKTFEVDEDKKEATLSASAYNALSLSGVTHIISPYKLYSDKLILHSVIKKPQGLDVEPFYIYQNKNTFPRYYQSTKSNKIETLEKFYNQLSDEKLLEDYKVLIEDDELNINISNPKTAKIDIIKNYSDEIILNAYSDTDTIFVTTDTNYPGWQAYLDGAKTKIYNINLAQRGIYFPKGQHEIRFVFNPLSFTSGKKITFLSVAIIFLVVFLSSLSFPHKVSDK